MTSESFAVIGGPGKGQLQPPQNIPFPDLHGRDGDEGMDIESCDQDSKVSELLEGEGIYYAEIANDLE